MTPVPQVGKCDTVTPIHTHHTFDCWIVIGYNVFMKFEFKMPGYRPPDTQIAAPPSGSSPELTQRDLYTEELMRIRGGAENKIVEITNRIYTDYESKDNIAPENLQAELEAWVKVAHQITWSLIRDLLVQQSLEIESANSASVKLEDQAPVLSWFQKATNFFRHAISRSDQSAEASETPAINPDPLTSSEIASATDTLEGIYHTLVDVFSRLPNLRSTALLRAILVTSIVLTLLPTASANAPDSLHIDKPASPPAQVSKTTLPEHLSTPIPQPLSGLFTPLSTPQLAAPLPALQLEQEISPQGAPRVTNKPSINMVAIKGAPQTTIGVIEEPEWIIETDRVQNITQINDLETIQRLRDYILRSQVKIPDFNSPELAQLSDEMQRAISASNVAIIDTDRPDHLFAHGSIVVDSKRNLSLHTIAHVVFLHLYQQQGGQSFLKDSRSMYLVVSDSEGLHYYQIKLSVSDISIDPTGKQDGLAKISLKLGDDLPGSYFSLPTIEPMSYFDYKNSTFSEGNPGSAFIYTSTRSFTPLIAQASFLDRELGMLNSWESVDEHPPPAEPISKDGDSGRGVIAEIDGVYYLVGVNRGLSQAVNPNGIYGQFDNVIMSYPYN